jgi:hypothetical protein
MKRLREESPSAGAAERLGVRWLNRWASGAGAAGPAIEEERTGDGDARFLARKGDSP